MIRFLLTVCLSAVALSMLGASPADALEEHAQQRRALLIGVNDYTQLNDLQYCQRDAEALRKSLIAAEFPEQNVQLIASGAAGAEAQPFRANIERAMKLIVGLADQGDMVLVSFSGHGIHVDGTTYLCPTEADENDPASTMIPLQWVYQQLTACRASQKMFWVDACRNEPRRGGSRAARSKDVEHINQALSRPPEGVLVLTSCKEGQVSWEDDGFQQGIFTHYLLEGLSGKADREQGDRNRVVSLLELYKFAHLNTKRTVAERRKQLQTPELFGKLAGDFDLVAATSPDPQDVLKLAHESAISESLKGDDCLRVLVEIAALQGIAGDVAASQSGFRLARELAQRRREQDQGVPWQAGTTAFSRDPLGVLAEGQALAGFVNEALETVTGITDADDKALALTEIGIAQWRKGDADAAKATLLAARKIADPPEVSPGGSLVAYDSRFHIAMAYARMGDLENVRDVVRSLPKNSDWLRDQLARILADTDHCEDGLAFAMDMGAENSDHDGWWHGATQASAIAYVARAQARLGRRSDAARTFEAAMQAAQSLTADRRLEHSLAVLHSQVEAGFAEQARPVLNRLSQELPPAGDAGFDALPKCTLLAVIQAKAGDTGAARHTLDETTAGILSGEFPNQSGTMVCLALTETGRVEDAVRTMTRCFAAKDPGISADWPEVVCALARRGAYEQAEQAVALLRQAFPESVLRLRYAQGLLQSSGLIDTLEFGTTKAFRSPQTLPGMRR